VHPVRPRDVGALAGDGREDLVRRLGLGDQRRDPAQRRLQVGVGAQLPTALGVGDGRRDQLAELRDPPLRVREGRLRACPAGHDRAPQPAAGGDRRAHGGAQAELVRPRTSVPLDTVVVLQRRRPARPEHLCRHAVPVEPDLGPDRRCVRHRARDRADLRDLLRLVADEGGHVGAEQAPHLATTASKIVVSDSSRTTRVATRRSAPSSSARARSSAPRSSAVRRAARSAASIWRRSVMSRAVP